MPDYVVHFSDVAGFIDEADAKGREDLVITSGLGEKTLGGTHTPLVYKWPNAVCLFKLESETEFDDYTHAEVVGVYSGESFVPRNGQANTKYHNVYSPRGQSKVATSGLLNRSYRVPGRSKLGEFS